MNRKLHFGIAGEAKEMRTHSILDLCDYLTVKVLEPMFARDGVTWDPHFMDFFSFDNSCDPMEPTGTIFFKVPSLFVGRLVELEDAITETLSGMGIKCGSFKHETDPSAPSGQMIVIPVVDNPTVLLAPPPVNIGFARGSVVLRDVLGYQQVNGRYEFAAEDLLKRISTVTEDRIAACTASPVKVEEYVRRVPSPSGMKAIRRCLDEIRQFAQWAARHNYQSLVAG